MSFKSSVAAGVGHLSYSVLHDVFNRGSSLPGLIALKIDPDILYHYKDRYDFVIVGGTNGKTTATALAVQALKQKYPDVLYNPTGSNMKRGIATIFVSAPKPKKKGLAVLEVDEANIVRIVKYFKPKAFVFTNLFRDQLDRYSELYATWDRMLEGVRMAPNATIIANADDPIFNSVDLPNPRVWYGFDDQPMGDLEAPSNTDGVVCPKCHHIIHYGFIIYGGLGAYFCPNCGHKRPELDYRVTAVDEMTSADSTVKFDDYEFKIPVGGSYNIYNALAAYSLSRFMGVDQEAIKTAFEKSPEIFGRQERVQIGDKEMVIIMVKNQIGVDTVLDMIKTDKEPFSFAFMLTALPADGEDTSWIWDCNFETLKEHDIPYYLVGASNYKDAATRFKFGGFTDVNVEPDPAKLIDRIKEMPTKRLYVVTCYTAMRQLRKALAEQKLIDGGME